MSINIHLDENIEILGDYQTGSQDSVLYSIALCLF